MAGYQRAGAPRIKQRGAKRKPRQDPGWKIKTPAKREIGPGQSALRFKASAQEEKRETTKPS